MKHWEVTPWIAVGRCTGMQVTRHGKNGLEVAHTEVATHGPYATRGERARVKIACEGVARFLNEQINLFGKDLLGA